VKALADEVVEQCKTAGYRPIGIEGLDNAEWVLVDLGDVIVHIMLPATRTFYDIERLWTARPTAPTEDA
jgi:ribosome-associated protein